MTKRSQYSSSSKRMRRTVDTIVYHIAFDALPLTFLKLSSLPPSRYEDVHSSGSFTRKWCMKAAFFLVNICWLASPMTPAPNLVLGGSLMNIVQKSVASITGSVPFLAEWAITSLRNAGNNKINKHVHQVRANSILDLGSWMKLQFTCKIFEDVFVRSWKLADNLFAL